MKKISLIIFGIAILCLLSFLSCSSSLVDLNLEENLTRNVKKYSNESTGVELMYSDGNNIYGHFYDSSINNVILRTKGLFKYNVKTSKFSYFNYKNQNRIMTYYWLNDIIYYVVLEESGNNFNWKFIVSKYKKNDEKIIMQGTIENPFNYPRILFNKYGIFLVSINDLDEENQIFQFDMVVEVSNILSLKQETGKKKEKTGNLLYNISNVYVEAENIFYTVVDKDNIQYLYSLNVITGEEKKIFENKRANQILYNFKIFNNDMMYIQMALKDEENMANIIYFKNNRKIIEKKGTLKTFDILYNSCIIFHNQPNIIEVFSGNNNRTYKKVIQRNDMYPKYLVVNGRIIMQDFDNKFYVSSSLKKVCN